MPIQPTLTRYAAGLALFCAFSSPRAADADFVLTAEAAGVQASQVSGVTTVNFNSQSSGTYSSLVTSIGTINSPGLAIVGANAYGGAGGNGKYFAIGAQSGSTTATLTLNSSQSYFGFWWSAADPQNKIEFLSGGSVVAQFNPTTALGSLSSAYLGNPNNNLDGGEKFAYLNLYGTQGSSFDQIRFTNQSQGSGFESDNWSVLAASTPPSGTTIPGGVTSVPEPSTLVLSAFGVIGLLGASIKRSRAANRA
ncbi:PEP-CTERM sorting domain-containing protein [Isosphaeraceae bacterium EP7]